MRMVLAYVMVKATTVETDKLKADIEAIDGIETVHIVAGDVDFIVRAEVADPGAVKAVVTDEIQALEGVSDTSTYIAMS